MSNLTRNSIGLRMCELRLLDFFVQKEKSQTAGPLQGHGERSPEGGAVWKENAEEEKKGLKNLRVSFLGLKMGVC